MDKLQEIRKEIQSITERPNLTYEAIKQLNELFGAEQCLMALQGNSVHLNAAANEKELVDLFPTLKTYQEEHTIPNLQKLCFEISEFCRAVYASTQNDAERQVYAEMLLKLNK